MTNLRCKPLLFISGYWEQLRGRESLVDLEAEGWGCWPGWWKGKIRGGEDSDTITLVTSSVAEAMGVREKGQFRNVFK